MHYVTSQFANPRGWLGDLAGRIMAYENCERNRWAISLLELQPAEHVIEVGFGPGWAIREMAQHIPDGRIASADDSEVMVHQAISRDEELVRQGRVDLNRAPAATLRFENAAFDKALSVNSIQIWADAVADMRNVQLLIDHLRTNPSAGVDGVK